MKRKKRLCESREWGALIPKDKIIVVVLSESCFDSVACYFANLVQG